MLLIIFYCDGIFGCYSGGARRRWPESILVLQIARKRLQEEEGKMRKLTRGSEGRESRRRRRSGGGSGSGEDYAAVREEERGGVRET
jgi:hypothetical protein